MDISVQQRDSVALITWNDGENRINLDSLARLNEILDELEGIDGPLAVVLTGAGKFFSNGLDLGRFLDDREQFVATLHELERTIGRVLVYPAYTVAALNGHTFAGGALISCAFDQRIMRSERGFWCITQADIGLALEERLCPILANRRPRATAIMAATTARRFAGPDALHWGIVEDLASSEELIERALELAQRMSSLDRATLRAHKQVIHGAEAAFLGYHAD